MRDEIVELIIETANELGDDEIGVDGPLEEQTALFGAEGRLDSMALVTLVVALEQALEDRYGKSISLADEKAMSQARSPYRTVGALADYAVSQVGGD